MTFEEDLINAIKRQNETCFSINDAIEEINSIVDEYKLDKQKVIDTINEFCCIACAKILKEELGLDEK